MNKIKHKSEKRVTEIQTIVFSDFKGLVAENMIITKDDISELKMTTFKLWCSWNDSLHGDSL